MTTDDTNSIDHGRTDETVHSGPLPLIRSLTHARLGKTLLDLGQPAWQTEVVKGFLYKHGVDRFDGMTSLSHAFQETLAAHFSAELPQTTRRRVAADGTVKVLLDWNGITAEAVFMPGVKGRTLCISTQSGCRLRCAFCATGTLGLKRSLSFGEILDQVLILSGEGAISRIVVMGMGEPLENLDELIPALTFLTSEKGLGFSRRRITVSTVGLVPEMGKLATNGGGVELALSLHATTDTLRTALMPINRKYPIEAILAAAKSYEEKANTKVTLEYVLLDGVNDTDDDVRRLGKIARKMEFPVNIIRFNPMGADEFAPSPRLEVFAKQLADDGTRVTVRKSRGQSIDAACGQLAGK